MESNDAISKRYEKALWQIDELKAFLRQQKDSKEEDETEDDK